MTDCDVLPGGAQATYEAIARSHLRDGTRQRCPFCLRERADDIDHDTLPGGARADLCWDSNPTEECQNLIQLFMSLSSLARGGMQRVVAVTHTMRFIQRLPWKE